MCVQIHQSTISGLAMRNENVRKGLRGAGMKQKLYWDLFSGDGSLGLTEY